jgi:hypothetical protein
MTHPGSAGSLFTEKRRDDHSKAPSNVKIQRVVSAERRTGAGDLGIREAAFNFDSIGRSQWLMDRTDRHAAYTWRSLHAKRPQTLPSSSKCGIYELFSVLFPYESISTGLMLRLLTEKSPLNISVHSPLGTSCIASPKQVSYLRQIISCREDSIVNDRRTSVNFLPTYWRYRFGTLEVIYLSKYDIPD